MPWAPKTRRPPLSKHRPRTHRHSTSKRGYDYWWQVNSKRWLKEEVTRTGNPWCRICNKAPATEVDHIIPPSSRFEQGTPEFKAMHRDSSNWQLACSRCNAKKRNRIDQQGQ